ncbi:unnamed protein product [Pocillopora meandrina]|uniref:Uncharacterized protein n=1 Tax=Pocillopora meandrina TaxID=46732 RepID=A0AAU9WD79_9CNID|nr:unnamed protein product [Pocillopora meandrina]
MWQSAEKELPSNLLLALGACDEDAFPNIHRLLLIACTLPINLAIIAVHYPERFEVDEICKAFVKAHPKRLFQATLFD